jgi:hypothetical protein
VKRRLYLGLVVPLVLASALTRAVADLPLPPDRFFQTPEGGVAPPETVAAAVGDVSFAVQCPETRELTLETAQAVQNETGVAVTLGKAGTGYRDPQVRNALLRAAALQVLNECPLVMLYPMGAGSSYPYYAVGYAYFYGHPSDSEGSTLLLSAQGFSPVTRSWLTVRDVEADREAQAAQAQQAQAAAAAAQAQQAAAAQQQQAEQQQQQAQAQQQALAQQQQQQQDQQQQAINAAASAQWWAGFWVFVRLLFFVAAGVWLFTKRNTILRWYYMMTPHPATDLVERIISGGAALDGRVFADINRDIPGNPVQQEVWAAQARELAGRVRHHAERTARDTRRERDVVQAQSELLDAANAYELAKARLEQLRKRAGHMT